MDFPPDWVVFPMEEFMTATPRNAGDLGMELLAQCRGNGRILDNYRIAIGGSKILEVSTSMSSLLLCPPTSEWIFKLQVWPRDIEIRRNMSTGPWQDLFAMISAREAWVVDRSGEQIPPEAVIREIQRLGHGGSARFAVVAGGDGKMWLNFQSLPLAAGSIMGKPTFRG